MENKKEIWKDIKGYELMYQISNYGNVRSLDRYVKNTIGGLAKKKGITLKKRINNRGYYTVTLKKEQIGKTFVCHRLVLINFKNNPHNKPIGNHKDGNKLNDYIDNLEWSTYSENTKHAFDNKLIYNPKGTERYNSKLNTEIVKNIRENKNGLKNKDLADKYLVSRSLITRIRQNKTWVNN